MNLYPQTTEAYLAILAILIRVTGLFLLIPGFSHPSIPVRIKILLALVLSFLIYPLVHIEIPLTLMDFVRLSLRESVVGLLMGFAAMVTFEGIRLSAQFIGEQMGLGMAGLIDPQTQSQVSVTVPLYSSVLLVLFFLTDMHHHALTLLVKSFEIEFQSSLIGMELVSFLTSLTAKIFLIAVKMAAPFTLLFLSCEVVIGILSRILPQMNILAISFPITVALGMISLLVLSPEMLQFMETSLEEMGNDIFQILRVL